MALKQAISSVSQSGTLLAANPIYFASFSGTSYTAQLEVNVAGDWLPAAAQITQAGNMATAALAGRLDADTEPLQWRWNVTAIVSGTLTVYIG
jgi:hypothetical protein